MFWACDKSLSQNCKTITLSNNLQTEKNAPSNHFVSVSGRFVKDGVSYSINTDDPVVLGNTITDDYKFANDMGITDVEIIRGVSGWWRTSSAFTIVQAYKYFTINNITNFVVKLYLGAFGKTVVTTCTLFNITSYNSFAQSPQIYQFFFIYYSGWYFIQKTKKKLSLFLLCLCVLMITLHNVYSTLNDYVQYIYSHNNRIASLASHSQWKPKLT